MVHGHAPDTQLSALSAERDHEFTSRMNPETVNVADAAVAVRGENVLLHIAAVDAVQRESVSMQNKEAVIERSKLEIDNVVGYSHRRMDSLEVGRGHDGETTLVVGGSESDKL